MRKTLLAFALLAVAIVAQASVLDPVTIAWKPKTGAVTKFNEKVTVYNPPIPGMTGDMKLAFTLTDTVKDIKSNGDVVTEEKQTDFSMKMGDQDMSQMAGNQDLAVTVTQSANGKTIDRKITAGPTDMDMPRLNQLQEFTFPDHPLNQGDTWKLEQKGESEKGTYNSETVFTYEGSEVVNGVPCYKIQTDYKETNAPTPMTATITTWLAQDTGDVVKGTGKIKNAQLGEQMPTPVDMDVSIERAS